MGEEAVALEVVDRTTEVEEVVPIEGEAAVDMATVVITVMLMADGFQAVTTLTRSSAI